MLANQNSQVDAALKQIGDLKIAAASMQEYQRNAQAFSAKAPRLIDLYPQRWVAVHQGKVVVDSASLEDVWRRVDDLGLNRRSVMVRFIRQQHRTMIL